MKNNKLKKFIFTPFVFIYDIATLFWCYIITLSIIDNFVTYKIGVDGLHTIIGGADTPTLIFIFQTLLGSAFQIVFVVISLFTAALLTIAVFKNQIKLKFNILFCITSVISLFIFMLIPAGEYAVQAYMTIRPIYILLGTMPFYLQYANRIYMIISLVVIILNLLLLIKNIKLKSQKSETAE